MLPILVILVFTLIDATITLKSQSVNLELETIFELDNDKDIHMLSNIQKFVNKVKNVLRNNKEVKTRQNKSESLADLLKNLIEVVKSLKDDEITQIFGVAGDQVKTFIFEDSFEYRDMRRLLSNKFGNLSKSPSNVRAKLDQLLRQVDKNNKLTRLINIIYKKDSKRDISRFLKKLTLFRRNLKRSKEELNVIAQNIIYDILEKYDALTKKNKKIVLSFLEGLILTSDVIENDHGNIEKKSESFEPEDDETSDEKESNKETHTIKNRVRRTRFSKKLTYITLYPSSIEINNIKKNFKMNRAMVKNLKTVKSENSFAKGTEKTNIKNDLSDYSNKLAVGKEIMDISDGDPTTTGELKTLRHHKQRTTKFKTSKVSSKKKFAKFDKYSSSYEHFGSLPKTSKTKTTNADILEENTTFGIKKDEKSTNILTNNLYLNRRAQSLVNTDNNTTVINEMMFLEKDDSGTSTDVTGKEREITKKYIDNKEVEVLSKNENNVTTAESFTTMNHTTMNHTTIENITFDVNHYLNNSEINNIKDYEQKKKIEDIMKEDLNNLFSTTTNSTDGYTDMFKELEEAFDFS